MFHPIANIEDAQTLAQAIVNTMVEPFLVLDENFRVLAANHSFYQTFRVDPEQTHGSLLYALGDGQWDIPALHLLLETIIPEKTAMDGFEVEHDFPDIGRRTMLLNARKVLYDHSSAATILLAFNDITARRAIEREKEELLGRTEDLLRQKDVLLREMEHRVANSLQIIASILLLKARSVTSDETRQHLKDAHQRVLSVAEVQRHLHASTGADEIEVGSYLSKLCSSLAASMIGEPQAIAVNVMAENGRIERFKEVKVLWRARQPSTPPARLFESLVRCYGSNKHGQSSLDAVCWLFSTFHTVRDNGRHSVDQHSDHFPCHHSGAVSGQSAAA
ncbi:histidine kinase dimerization/phosphoacceptor domain -containing protein [Mesorhizobium sp. M1163]|uniref:sensor histidine kinase n=1 Tax=Mesorhizobium sp. M1163 TaxID=2957065 RepID=UPI00333BC71D